VRQAGNDDDGGGGGGYYSSRGERCDKQEVLSLASDVSSVWGRLVHRSSRLATRIRLHHAAKAAFFSRPGPFMRVQLPTRLAPY
jgi:hypothetical protein